MQNLSDSACAWGIEGNVIAIGAKLWWETVLADGEKKHLISFIPLLLDNESNCIDCRWFWFTVMIQAVLRIKKDVKNESKAKLSIMIQASVNL